MFWLWLRGITDTKFGRLVVRPDSGDPAETCTAILKSLGSLGSLALVAPVLTFES